MQEWKYKVLGFFCNKQMSILQVASPPSSPGHYIINAQQ